MIVGVPDSKLNKWLEGKEYLVATDEGEAVAIGVGYYLATGKRAQVFMGSNGFCNALDALTSLIIPYKIPMNLIIGIRVDEVQHQVMGEKVEEILKIFNLEATIIK